MKSVRLSAMLLLGLMFGLIQISGAGFAEEKAVKTIEATVRATCEGLPIKDIGINLSLVDPQSGEKIKVKGRTDPNGAFSFSIPPGTYECRSQGTSHSSSTVIVGPEGEKPFRHRDYFNGSRFWTSRKKKLSFGPESSAAPDFEFIPRFEVVHPADGSEIKELLPVFKWKSVEGAESYTVRISEWKTGKKGMGKTGKNILRKKNITTTEWKLDTPLFESGKEYFVEIEALGPEGIKINKSKRAEFTVAGGEVKEPR